GKILRAAGARRGALHAKLLLLGNHQPRDLFVRRLGQDFLADQVGLLGIWTAVNDLLSVGVANTRESLQLVKRGGIDVHAVLGLFGFARLGRFTGGLRQWM